MAFFVSFAANVTEDYASEDYASEDAGEDAAEDATEDAATARCKKSFML